jgi:tetratricopeptide (TPR) repeat protein
MFGVYVDQKIQSALHSATDRASRLSKMRRQALRRGDAGTAAACLLQTIIDAPPEGRLRLLRRYARETGSQVAIHTLAGLLHPNARTDAALLRMLRTTNTLPESEKQILAMLFGPVRTVHVRELLQRVLRRCDERFPREQLCATALLELLEVEQSRGDWRSAQGIAERLVRESPSPLAFQLLGLATEQLRDFEAAAAAYLRGAELAAREGDSARGESLRHKVLALNKRRPR